MFPIKHMVKQMETLFQCYCFETIATCQVSDQQNPYVDKIARDYPACRDCYRTSIQSVPQRPAKGPVDDSNAPLLTQKAVPLVGSGQFVRKNSKDRPTAGEGCVSLL